MMCLFLVDTYNTTINDERPASVWIIKTVQMILNVSQDGCAYKKEVLCFLSQEQLQFHFLFLRKENLK